MKTDINFWSYLAQFFFEWEMFQTRVVEKFKTHILFSVTFSQKSRRLWDNVEKIYLCVPRIRPTVYRTDFPTRPQTVASDREVSVLLEVLRARHCAVGMTRGTAFLCAAMTACGKQWAGLWLLCRRVLVRIRAWERVLSLLDQSYRLWNYPV
jgi:hypothetical protein